MAGQTLTLTIASQLQKAGFTEAAEHMKKLQSEIEGSKEKSSLLKDAFEELKGIMLGIATIEFLKSSIEEAMAAEQAEVRLKTAIEATGASWERNKARVKDYAEVMAKNTRFANDEINDSLRVMVQRTNSVQVAMADMNIAMGISVATGRSLAESADLVGRAANGDERSIRALNREFGLNTKAQADAMATLTELNKKFGTLATNSNMAADSFAKMKNTYSELKESIGGNMMPAIIKSMEAIRALVLLLSVSFDEVKLKIGGLFYALTLQWGKLVDFDREMRAKIKQGGADFQGAFWEIWFGKGKDEKALEQEKPQITRNAKLMSAELIDIMQKMKQDTADTNAKFGQTELEALKQNTERTKAEIQKRDDFAILSAQNKAAIMQEVDMNYLSKKMLMEKQMAKEEMSLWMGYAAQYGEVTYKMLKGEKDAWREVTASIIDMIVQRAQAAIIAYYAEKAASALKEAPGYAGLALAAGWIALGAAAAGAVGAVGAAAKAAVLSGGSSSASTTSAGYASAGAGTTSYVGGATASSSSGGGLTVNLHVYGDYIGDDSYVAKMAQRISDLVQNNDVRLLATSTTGA